MIGEHREVDSGSPSTVLWPVVWEVGRQFEVGQQPLGAVAGVDRFVQATQPHLVHRKTATDVVEAHRGDAVLRREPRLEIGGLGERATGSQHPRRVGVFLVGSHEQSVLANPVGEGARPDRAPDPPTAVGPEHQVDQPVAILRDQPHRYQVSRRRLYRTTSGVHLDQAAVVPACMHMGDGRRHCVWALAGTEHLIADHDRLDRAAPARSADQAAGRQALIRVAHHAHVVVITGEHQHDLVLGLVGVLVLVDEDVAEPLAVVVEDVGVLAEQAHDVEQQVVEVHRTGTLESCLVLGVHVGMLAVEDVLGLGGSGCRVDQFVLPE